MHLKVRAALQLTPRRRCTAAFAVQPAECAAAAPEAAPPLHAGREPAGPEPPEHMELPAEHAARNAALVARLRGKLILAPLTRGGNVPFRRLCADFGAEARAAHLRLRKPLEVLLGPGVLWLASHSYLLAPGQICRCCMRPHQPRPAPVTSSAVGHAAPFYQTWQSYRRRRQR